MLQFSSSQFSNLRWRYFVESLLLKSTPNVSSVVLSSARVAGVDRAGTRSCFKYRVFVLPFANVMTKGPGRVLGKIETSSPLTESRITPESNAFLKSVSDHSPVS